MEEDDLNRNIIPDVPRQRRVRERDTGEEGPARAAQRILDQMHSRVVEVFDDKVLRLGGPVGPARGHIELALDAWGHGELVVGRLFASLLGRDPARHAFHRVGGRDVIPQTVGSKDDKVGALDLSYRGHNGRGGHVRRREVLGPHTGAEKVVLGFLDGVRSPLPAVVAKRTGNGDAKEAAALGVDHVRLLAWVLLCDAVKLILVVARLVLREGARRIRGRAGGDGAQDGAGVTGAGDAEGRGGWIENGEEGAGACDGGGESGDDVGVGGFDGAGFETGYGLLGVGCDEIV